MAQPLEERAAIVGRPSSVRSSRLPLPRTASALSLRSLARSGSMQLLRSETPAHDQTRNLPVRGLGALHPRWSVTTIGSQIPYPVPGNRGQARDSLSLLHPAWSSSRIGPVCEDTEETRDTEGEKERAGSDK